MEKRFLGTGWRFPVGLDEEGRFETVSDEEDIREAILIILKTAPGERVMQPEFGCGINDYIFSVINSATMMEIEKEVKRALLLYEPRIVTERVEVSAEDASEGKLLISIDYTVKSSNSRQNMVYPFYLKEKG